MLSQGARHFFKTYNILCGTFSAALFRTRVHALHSLSAQGITGGSEVPAYDRCYILATDIYVVVFRAVCIRIYCAVLIATPEAVQTSARAIYCTGKNIGTNIIINSENSLLT